MAETLIVKQAGGIQVGIVTVDRLGKLRATAARPDLASEFDEMIARLALDRITRMTGHDVAGPGGLVHQTLGRAVQLGQPGYLSALADAVTWSHETIGGIRLRAWVTDRPAES